MLLVIATSLLMSCKNKSTSTTSVSYDGMVDGNSILNVIPLEDTLKRSAIEWIDTIKELGTIPKKGQVDIMFRFKNIGKKPLSIISVQAGCGCTSPQKPAKPVAPGEEGFVKAKFNAESQNGEVTKSITVVSNTEPSTKQLFFKANVVADMKQ